MAAQYTDWLTGTADVSSVAEIARDPGRTPPGLTKVGGHRDDKKLARALGGLHASRLHRKLNPRKRPGTALVTAPA